VFYIDWQDLHHQGCAAAAFNVAGNADKAVSKGASRASLGIRCDRQR
jgi:hypothetical protein